MALDAQQDDPLVGHFGGDSGPAPAPSPTAKEPDDPLVGHFGTGEAGGVTPYTPAPDWHASDLPKGLEVGFHTGIGAPLAEVTGQTEEAKAERQRAEQTRAGMTPGAEQTWPVFIAEQAAPADCGLRHWPCWRSPGAGVAISGGVAATLGVGKRDQRQPGKLSRRRTTPRLELIILTMPSILLLGLTEQQAKEKLGTSTALSVAAPSALIQGAAAVIPGLELTGAFKLGVGAAENAALTGGNFLTKPVTGRAGQAIAGAGRSGLEMGVAGAAQEGVTKHAEAQEGVGSEATGSELLTAGTGQGLFGATMGMLGGGWHGSNVENLGKHTRDLTQTGGEATAARAPPDQGYRKPEAAQITAPVDINTPPENKVAAPSHGCK